MCAGYTQSAGEGHPECVRHNPFSTLYLYKKDRQGRPDTGEREGGHMSTRGRECDQILVVKLPITPRAVTVTSWGFVGIACRAFETLSRPRTFTVSNMT
jgi:hypothetical protein